MLDWFMAASRYTGFHERLKDHILPLLPPGGTLADLGCGAGMIDLELAPHVRHLTCIDQSGEAILFLTRQAGLLGYQNLEARQADAFALKEQWDTVLMLFFGHIADNLDYFLSLCRKNVIAVVRATPDAQFAPPKRLPGRRALPSVRQALDMRGIDYSLTEASLEYGQPLRDIGDARAFIHTYSPMLDSTAIDAYLDERLIRTNRSDYPLYLPNHKSFGIFSIRRSGQCERVPPTRR